MSYVRCINNTAYVRAPDDTVSGPLADLTLGAVYKVLPTPQPEQEAGLLRIIDNSGEDYLYPADYFQPLDWAADWESGPTALTMHLDSRTKAILRAEAVAAQTSMSALVRQWIEERLELPGRRETTR